MYEIIPSPGTENKDIHEVEEKIEKVRPLVKTIHIDVCDGIFAPNKTFSDPEAFKKVTEELPESEGGFLTGSHGLVFEVHLMVEEPIDHLKRWADAGFRRFIGQVEKMSDQIAFVAAAQEYGEVALGVDGPTSLDAIEVSYEDLDAVLFYTGDKAGYSGKPFQEDRLEKVKKLREMMPYLPIEADGGINDETIQIAASAGVTRFVTTGFLFNMQTPEKQFELLKKQLDAFEQLRK